MALSIQVRKVLLIILLAVLGLSLIGFVVWFFYFFSSDMFRSGEPKQYTEPVALIELESAITPTVQGIEEETVIQDDLHSAALIPTKIEEIEPEIIEPTVARFLIEGFPTRVEQGVALSFEVTPVDIDGVPVQFDGAIRFTSSDEGAILPADYDFTNSEGDKIFFESAVAFEELGIQSIQVTSIDDSSVSGEILVAVVPSKKPIEILLPQPGETSDLQVVIRGETQQGISSVDIYDGGKRIGQNVEVGDDGSFIFVTGFLTPGTHKIKIVDAKDSQVASDPVVLKVKRD